ncbi:cytochrome c oxidase assembly protein [Rhodococcus chondri]|uniref:Cytochrome c oxidase assembly protein n=1 Tax=Rhodococcus chondri TaxID=3065941 RepID=A0ABU7JWU0_9NOCA|nr:cytochrome c oxidase assembly protein [Rhodococcus sp. CC-R104]MEE2034488.1 cytochrome c oxidase assembly protein [Rhodococcus sp. CC-R104]
MTHVLVWSVALCAVVVYATAAARTHAWPPLRTLCWSAGWCALVAVLTRPGHDGHDFVAHMVEHVVVGMVVPLLLVLAAPMTLVLRTLPVTSARHVSRVLRSEPVAVLTHPVTAAILNIGGLWLLYRTSLFDRMQADTWVMWAVTFHVVTAGYLYTFSLVGVDPSPRRAVFGTRATVLVLSIAAHNVLAKTLYADPPAGVPVEQAELGAQVMYYAGMPVELALLVLLCHRWAARDRGPALSLGATGPRV